MVHPYLRRRQGLEPVTYLHPLLKPALEDEGGLINVVLKPEVYEASRKALRSVFVVVEGRLQRRGEAISVLARRVVAVRLEGNRRIL